ncbi:MAG: V-type ATP synthase subunit I [Promethearchaeota archaeon]
MPAKMKKFNAVVLDRELDSTLRLIAGLGVAHFIDVQHRMEELDVKLEPVEASDRFYQLSNLLTRVTTLIADMGVIRGGGVKEVFEVPEIPSERYLTSLDKDLKHVEGAFADLSKALQAAEEAEDKSARKAAQKSIKQLAAEKRDQLLAWEELLQREHRFEETKTLFGKTKRTYVLAGWVPAKEAKAFAEAIAKHGKGRVSLDIEDYHEPHHGHGEEAEPIDRPPTKLTNTRFFRSAENLTKAFGIPSHRELDPSFFMAIGFPIIFGLMFGDIGHGLLLLFFSCIGLLMKKKEVDLGELGNYFIKGSGLLAVCAISATFFGVLYGEFFGLGVFNEVWYVALRDSPFGMIMRGFLINLFRLFDFDAGFSYYTQPAPSGVHHGFGLDHHGHTQGAIWFSAFDTPQETWILFVLSIIIGVIHLAIAIFLDLVNKIRRREWKHAIFGPVVWLWFFFGLAILLFNKGINFMDWFSWDCKVQPNLFGSAILDALILLIIPLLVMMFGGMIASGFMEGFMEGLEHLIASISNTISYARILALNMAHAGFAKTFLFIGGVTDTLIEAVRHGMFYTQEISLMMFIVMALVGTIFVLIMEGLLSFIHTLRLHWVEAYLKFYAGTGYEYKPLTLPSKWTTPA